MARRSRRAAFGAAQRGRGAGPACYARGGTEPTVTDADLVLGYLDPQGSAQYLGRVDAELARTAIATRVAQPLGLSTEDAARGIFDLANAQMADAVRLVSVAKGFDPRDLALVAFGGAGPVHAWAIARELGITRILIPPHAGVYSAVGLLGADVRVDQARGVRIRLADPEAAATIRTTVEELERETRATLEAQGQRPEAIVATYAADMRYVGQSYEITVPFDVPAHLRDAFDAEHAQVYGQANPGEPVEIIALRVTASVPGTPLRFETLRGAAGAAATPPTTRAMRFDERALEVPVWAREALPAGGVEGPAAVVQSDTTTVVPPGGHLRAGGNGFLELTLEGAS